MELEQEQPQKKQRSRKLRACLRCKILKTEGEWKSLNACPNCPINENFSYRANFNHFKDCTTINFEGMVATINPTPDSWVHRHVNKSARVIPGIYALKLNENINDDVLNYFENPY